MWKRRFSAILVECSLFCAPQNASESLRIYICKHVKLSETQSFCGYTMVCILSYYLSISLYIYIYVNILLSNERTSKTRNDKKRHGVILNMPKQKKKKSRCAIVRSPPTWKVLYLVPRWGAKVDVFCWLCFRWWLLTLGFVFSFCYETLLCFSGDGFLPSAFLRGLACWRRVVFSCWAFKPSNSSIETDI